MGVRVREKQKGSGEWWIFIYHRGKRASKKVGRSEDKARAVAKEIEARLVLGDLGMLEEKKQIPTFGEYSEEILGIHSDEQAIFDLRAIHSSLEDHVLPSFGKRPLDKISRGEVRDFIVEKSKKFKPFVFRDVIIGVFNYAIDDELVKVNPARGITKRSKSKGTDPKKWTH